MGYQILFAAQEIAQINFDMGLLCPGCAIIRGRKDSMIPRDFAQIFFQKASGSAFVTFCLYPLNLSPLPPAQNAFFRLLALVFCHMTALEPEEFLCKIPGWQTIFTPLILYIPDIVMVKQIDTPIFVFTQKYGIL